MGAFRVAVELDLKREDNDKKFAVLFVEMRDMMAVLGQYVLTSHPDVPCDTDSQYKSAGSGRSVGTNALETETAQSKIAWRPLS